MPGNLLVLVDRIRSALEDAGTLTRDDLLALLTDGEDPSHLDRALLFLHGREAILIDAIDRTVHLRAHLTNAVLLLLAYGPLSLEQLAQRAPVDMALVCDVLGWLEREGRVRILPGDVVEIRGKTRH